MCTALQLGGDVEQPWLMTSSIKPEVHKISIRRQEDQATAMGNMHKTFGENQMRSSKDMIVDRQTHTDRQTDTLITMLHAAVSE